MPPRAFLTSVAAQAHLTKAFGMVAAAEELSKKFLQEKRKMDEV
jgi:hypothetical protein